MAQSNVAREPSMEEILASIRKIIESNEPGGAPSLSASLPPVYVSHEDDADIHLTIDDELEAIDHDGVPPMASDPDPRFVAANSAGREPETAPRSTMSLADVAARVRAASDRNSAQMNPQRETQPSREMPPAMAARLAEVRLGGHPMQAETIEPAPMAAVSMGFAAEMSDVVVPMRPIEPSADIVSAQARSQPHENESGPAREMPRSSQAAQPERAAAPVAERAAAAQPSYAEPAAPFVAPVEQHDRFLPKLQEEAHKMLVSEATGEQVARSFDELAAALGAERRSLDEIAQDMLRPMLQEWLDDNLPTLVERLVREEIERVARGPRR